MSTLASCCLVPRSKNSVLSSFNISRSLIIHFLKSMMQSHIAFIALASSPCTFGLNAKYNCLSSAEECTLGKCRPTVSNSLLVYTVNRSGPRHDPCGTPCASQKVSDSPPLTTKRCVRSERYDVNQLSAWLVTPSLGLNRSSKMSWRTVSKAALRSKRTSKVTFCASIFNKISFITFKRADSVL